MRQSNTHHFTAVVRVAHKSGLPVNTRSRLLCCQRAPRRMHTDGHTPQRAQVLVMQTNERFM